MTHKANIKIIKTFVDSLYEFIQNLFIYLLRHFNKTGYSMELK